ncbi:MAG: phage tail protein I [Roseitalea sp.]|nr:phage tail protein I [Roseitalea sp.]MBO6950980.1 phage tail protein I [Rhizobiaceae bacterium]MBO6591033.1 phage tail protein I [Roseitalea sp.]MBO6599709.1 phage tail protein I [Roseitalea sp.]MBO6611465.1 phage tail protein I [Roseitalea sp.]
MDRHDLTIPLPANQTALENVFAKMADRVIGFENPTRPLFDPWLCPAEFLPYLAWANSVDIWDDEWPEVEKRREIEAAAKIHRLKGTVAALRTALDRLGAHHEIVEWFQTAPPGIAGTFRVFVDVGDADSLSLREEAAVRIRAAKPKSRSHGLKVGRLSDGPLGVVAACQTASTIVSEPYVFDGDLDHDGPLGIAAALVTRSTITSEAN